MSLSSLMKGFYNLNKPSSPS